MQFSSIFLALLATNLSQVLAAPVVASGNDVIESTNTVSRGPLDDSFPALAARGKSQSKPEKGKKPSSKAMAKAAATQEKHEAKYIGECLKACDRKYQDCMERNPSNKGGCWKLHSICVRNCHDNQDIY